METKEIKKSPIDIAAKELCQQICNFQDMLLDAVHHYSFPFELYCEFKKKSSEFARYIDEIFYNDND